MTMNKNHPTFQRAKSNRRISACAAAILLLCASASHAQNQFVTLNVSQDLTLATSPAVRMFGLQAASGSIYSAGPRVGVTAPWDWPSLDLRTAQTTPGYDDVSTFLWDAGRSAFRVGVFNSASLNPWTMGAFSFAYGYKSVASGTASLAGGLLSQSPGYGSVALGSVSTASSNYSFAVGDHAMATAPTAFAAGSCTTAVAQASAAINYGTLACGFSSFAAGFRTRTDAYASFTIGCWNLASSLKVVSCFFVLVVKS